MNYHNVHNCRSRKRIGYEWGWYRKTVHIVGTINIFHKAKKACYKINCKFMESNHNEEELFEDIRKFIFNVAPNNLGQVADSGLQFFTTELRIYKISY